MMDRLNDYNEGLVNVIPVATQVGIYGRMQQVNGDDVSVMPVVTGAGRVMVCGMQQVKRNDVSLEILGRYSIRVFGVNVFERVKELSVKVVNDQVVNVDKGFRFGWVRK